LLSCTYLLKEEKIHVSKRKYEDLERDVKRLREELRGCDVAIKVEKQVEGESTLKMRRRSW
jgi:hypothetical protein